MQRAGRLELSDFAGQTAKARSGIARAYGYPDLGLKNWLYSRIERTGYAPPSDPLVSSLYQELAMICSDGFRAR